MTASYSDSDWHAQMESIFTRLEPPPPCQSCNRTGFYGPREAVDGRRYSLCKFCGRYQRVGEDVVICRPTVHGCASSLQVVGAPYIRWVQPSEVSFKCECGVEVLSEKALVARPVDNPKHPWWQVPQNLSFSAAAAFWAQQGQGRVYL